MPLHISVLNQKGGVGKTTTSVNLAVGFAQRGLRTLVVDVDTQRNATQFLGIDPDTAGWGTADLLLDASTAWQPHTNVLLKGLDVVPGTHRLALCERFLLADVIAGPKKLKRALEPHFSRYDAIICDCGPSLGLLALNAVLACPSIVVPIELAHAATMGAMTLRQWLEGIRLDVDGRVSILGVLGTFHDERERTPGAVLQDLQTQFNDRLFNTVIHTSTAVRDAAGQGSPVLLSAPRSRGAAEYLALTAEVVSRCNS